jgi:hypothetical protein
MDSNRSNFPLLVTDDMRGGDGCGGRPKNCGAQFERLRRQVSWRA